MSESDVEGPAGGIQSGRYNLLREVTVGMVIDRPNGFLKGR
jgi:hypothetical protein